MLQQHYTNQNLDKYMVFCTISAVCSVYNKYPFPVKFLLKSIQIYTTTYFFSYLCSVKPLLKPTNGLRQARHIYIKGVTVRFGFDVLELRTLYGLSKTKQRKRLMGVLYTSLIDIGSH